MRMIKSLFREWNDSIKDFAIHMAITLVITGVWGLVMGLMGEYR